ncbi:MAG: cytochrome C oxidase subunit IV family protein [Bacteroidales bacterium]|nr:cytochrome C oxidase subunit IV family protein [Bacteroidales bacterium]MCF8405980.1 cytochrome C oxidase subunit IV family protein [Bacteroidales bacterium]
MTEEKHTIVSFKTQILILLALLTMTGISVAVTRIELGTLTVTVALILATIKSSLVLSYYMHLKFDNRIYTIMVVGVVLVISAVIFITFLDYLYR